MRTINFRRLSATTIAIAATAALTLGGTQTEAWGKTSSWDVHGDQQSKTSSWDTHSNNAGKTSSWDFHKKTSSWD